MNRRKHPRIPFQLPVSFTGPHLEGAGQTLNISKEGCAVEGDRCPKEGDYIVLSLTLPDQEAPMIVASAAVRWATNRSFGVQFVYMNPSDHERLDQLIGSALSGAQMEVANGPEGRGAVPVDRRREARFSVRFRTSFASAKMLGGEGTVTEISAGGCRLTCETPVPTESMLELQLSLEDNDLPIRVTDAVVRWSKGNEIGIEFCEIDPESFDRLEQLITKLSSS